jgi:hypothetical protein
MPSDLSHTMRRMCMGCRLRDHVRVQDERRRRRREGFHEALNASLAAQDLPQLPPQTFGQLRIDVSRYAGLRTELAAERRRRRELLRTARLEQRTSGCTHHEIAEAA